MLSAKEIRQSFKDFFASKGHRIVPSAPMVIKDDPTLMFTNAGMNQFKDIILGQKVPESRRVADSQKCLRVSGKHNDLEEVGHDTYHPTLFEMLGNWSFGDYFKAEAIDMAWEYLVDVLKLDPARLYATIFEGSPAEGLARDDEAAAIWLKHLPADHIINGNKHDNFWEMGDTGPCGPCSEIHIDLRSDAERAAKPGVELVNHDHPQVIEIWNLVFMQYNRRADGSLEPLPAKVIDTGMGFERLCMALQGKTSNYDTDVFTPLIDKISQLSGKKYGADKDVDVAMRVIADHVRTIAFSIADSQLPSNAKAGYVIRRILRRAVRYAYTFLEQKQAFMYRLVDTLIADMGDAYPEIAQQRDLIVKVIKEEEDAFLRTLENGIRLLDDAVARAKAEGRTTIDGREAFTLYDTYGFPLDLTMLILRDSGMDVDQAGFDAEMQAQKERARAAAAVEAGDWVILADGEQQFVGYDADSADTRILRYRHVKQKNRDFYQLILDTTPFYGEMGGQTGDRGTLTDKTTGEVTEVTDTKRENGVAVHIVKKLPADPEAVFTAAIDKDARMATSANHSATHLLHHALREVLGSHVEQKGSYVSPEVLRFDFSHFQKVTPEELRKVERLANRMVRAAMPLDEHRDMPIADARQMGAMALFGEKYGDKVRVVRYGDSIELCGGTHVANTGNIGMIRIVSESSIAAGVRRIEAITAANVEDALDAVTDTVKAVGALLGNAPDVTAALRKALDENADLKHQAEEYFKERIDNLARTLVDRADHTAAGTTLVTMRGTRMPDVVKGVAFAVRKLSPVTTAFVAATTDAAGKPLLTIALTDDLTSGANASTIVRQAAKSIKGGGGGQPGFAQAGGKDADGLEKAFAEMAAAIN
ncbi:MAG: alanine--tRNA ligase [Muribaculaceae bacterium]|nr:alanine--tRNA ligase [Muribaculaceae bacterium]